MTECNQKKLQFVEIRNIVRLMTLLFTIKAKSKLILSQLIIYKRKI